MVTVVQLAERPVVVREVAGSSPVSHPVVSHGVVMVGYRKTPNLDRLVRFGVFCCYHAEKYLADVPTRCRLAPAVDRTPHLTFDRAVCDLRFLARTIACTLWRSETAPPRARNKPRA